MTYAAIPTLRREPMLAQEWAPRFAATTYDARLLPGAQKPGALCGMGLTEKQGGSDLRATTTSARPLGKAGAGEAYFLTGHKWFCSAPMCDAFFVLAQTTEGLTCFLLPRVLPDGARNVFRIQRLKDKLGNRSNASSEVEFQESFAVAVGPPGEGIKTIVAMVNQTRLDCIIGSAAGMRQAAVQAVHHAAHRAAFGKLLIEQPLMKNVLTDLVLESEAATALMLRLAHACDRAARGDASEALMLRIGTALGKYWICKRGAAHAGEALECLGGNGYVEESIMPRLYREAPLNSLWEGSGNVNALDVLRVLQRSPDTVEAYFAELSGARSHDARLARACDQLRHELSAPEVAEWNARRIVERMAVALQAVLLAKHSPGAVADAFCAARLGEPRSYTFGSLPEGIDAPAIIRRAMPQPV
ncbi:MAG: acyl-CoA dehydrogenase family protein, partial [Candidatus Eremiobacteraeota bacterium]|nr:acyl-CoA dehydrogenase family protein [Candidatus Eremiobacteraeota bacterium]